MKRKIKNMNVEKRLQALEEIARNENCGLFTVVYKDGSRRIITPLEALEMCNSYEAAEISRFTGATDEHNGILVEIVNYILHENQAEAGKDGTGNEEGKL